MYRNTKNAKYKKAKIQKNTGVPHSGTTPTFIPDNQYRCHRKYYISILCGSYYDFDYKTSTFMKFNSVQKSKH